MSLSGVTWAEGLVGDARVTTTQVHRHRNRSSSTKNRASRPRGPTIVWHSPPGGHFGIPSLLTRPRYVCGTVLLVRIDLSGLRHGVASAYLNRGPPSSRGG